MKSSKSCTSALDNFWEYPPFWFIWLVAAFFFGGLWFLHDLAIAGVSIIVVMTGLTSIRQRTEYVALYREYHMTRARVAQLGRQVDRLEKQSMERG